MGLSLPRWKAFVKTLPCCHCRAQGVDPHHMIGVDAMGATGMTNSDLALMPLCRTCHDLVHADSGQGWPQMRWVIETLDAGVLAGVIQV